MLISGIHRKELSGGFRQTTNNRMELLAVISGLEALKVTSDVTLYSDSKYVVDGISKGWAANWRTKGWRLSNGKPTLNPDLWERLLELCEQHEVEFRWVRGHAGNTGNERADTLATQASKSDSLSIDEGYGSTQQANAPEQQSVADHPPTKMTEPGHPCRKCGTPVERRETKRKTRKPNQTYYFEWHLYCPGCKTNYMVESAKRYL